MRRNWLHKGLLVLLGCALMAGCTSGTAQEQGQKSRFKIMFSDESYFYQEYGDLYTISHPDVEIEVVSMNSLINYSDTKSFDHAKAFSDFVDKEMPDIVLLSSSNGDYQKFVEDGKLMELDSLIQRDKYDLDTFYSGMVDVLKEEGDGKLYGLSPTFSPSAVLYNADLFAKYGIEVPHDGMTWKEILDLARRFPTEGDKDTRVYGFGMLYGDSLESLASEIAGYQGLQMLSPSTMKLTLNSDSWVQAYKLAKDALDSNAIYKPDSEGDSSGTVREYYQNQLFVNGRVAMTVENFSTLRNLKQAQDSLEDYKPFQIGVAAGPVDPADPESSRGIFFNDIFAIRANSPNADAAWDFIKYVNGEECAKVKSKSISQSLLSRMGYSEEYKGIDLEPFYKLKPKLDRESRRVWDMIPKSFYPQYQPILNRELQLVQANKKSIEEALQTVQKESQVVLDMLLKEEAEKSGTSDSAKTETSAAGTTKSFGEAPSDSSI